MGCCQLTLYHTFVKTRYFKHFISSALGCKYQHCCFSKLSKRQECRNLNLFPVEHLLADIIAMSRRQITALYTDQEMTSHIWSKQYYLILQLPILQWQWWQWQLWIKSTVNKMSETLGLYKVHFKMCLNINVYTIKCVMLWTFVCRDFVNVFIYKWIYPSHELF